jgi:hypothetical protein
MYARAVSYWYQIPAADRSMFLGLCLFMNEVRGIYAMNRIAPEVIRMYVQAYETWAGIFHHVLVLAYR